jgi:hypothetical protein
MRARLPKNIFNLIFQQVINIQMAIKHKYHPENCIKETQQLFYFDTVCAKLDRYKTTWTGTASP